MLHALDQQIIGDLDLPGRGMVGALDRADQAQVGRVGHVEHRQPRFPEVGRVEIPTVVDDLHGQLENGFTANIVVADELDTVGGVAGRGVAHAAACAMRSARSDSGSRQNTPPVPRSVTQTRP